MFFKNRQQCSLVAITLRRDEALQHERYHGLSNVRTAKVLVWNSMHVLVAITLRRDEALQYERDGCMSEVGPLRILVWNS
jgi:hypothetical protein